MKIATFALSALLATLVSGGAVAQGNTYLAAYGGGGGGSILSGYGGSSGGNGDYRNALRRYGGGGSSYGNVGNGYTGASAPTRAHYQGGNSAAHSGFSGRFTGRFNAQWQGLGWNNSLGGSRWAQAASTPPCGNFSRAAAACRKTTMAWDPSFQTQRGW